MAAAPGMDGTLLEGFHPWAVGFEDIVDTGVWRMEGMATLTGLLWCETLIRLFRGAIMHWNVWVCLVEWPLSQTGIVEPC
jgi:hypothetical protein